MKRPMAVNEQQMRTKKVSNFWRACSANLTSKHEVNVNEVYISLKRNCFDAFCLLCTVK